MKKFIALLLALVMALALVACGAKDNGDAGKNDGDVPSNTQTDTDKDTKTDGDVQAVDLRAAYDAAIAQVNEALGSEAPVLLETTDMDMLDSYYPGIKDVATKQLVAFQSPTGTACEVIMVEVENAADAETVRQLFQTRVDSMADNTTYPEEAGMWKNQATVSVNGSYVVLEVLPEGCTVPDAFLAKF